MSVLDRLLAAGISVDTAHEEFAAGVAHVDGIQVLDSGTPADRPAVIVSRDPSG